MTNYARKAFFGASITLVFSILASIIAYLTRIVLARNLTTEQYGLFYAVFSFIIFFLFFRSLGLDQALVKYIAEFKVHNKYNSIKTAIISVFTFQLISSLIFAALFLIFANFLALNYFKEPLASKMIFYLVFYVIFSILFIISKHIFQGLQQMFLYSSVEFTKNLIILLLVLYFFKQGYTLFSPVFAFALVCPILFLIYLPFVLKKFNFTKYKIQNFKPISKKLLLFGIPVFATSVGGKFIGYIDTLILTYYGNLTQVGIYNVVLPSALIFLFFSKAISSVIFPLSSELWIKKDTDKLKNGLAFIHKYIFVIMLPAILTVFYYSPFFINLLFGKQYISGVPSFQILLIGVMLYVTASVNNNVIAGIGKPAQVTKIILLSAVINVVLNIILIPIYGIIGAAAATTTSYLFMLLYSTSILSKCITIKSPYKIWASLILPAGFFLMLIAVIERILSINIWLEIIITFLVAILVYTFVLWMLRIINIKEIKSHLKAIRK